MGEGGRGVAVARGVEDAVAEGRAVDVEGAGVRVADGGVAAAGGGDEAAAGVGVARGAGELIGTGVDEPDEAALTISAGAVAVWTGTGSEFRTVNVGSAGAEAAKDGDVVAAADVRAGDGIEVGWTELSGGLDAGACDEVAEATLG